jgi:hypothetical protein
MRLVSCAKVAHLSVSVKNILQKTLCQVAEASHTPSVLQELSLAPGSLYTQNALRDDHEFQDHVRRTLQTSDYLIEDAGEVTDYQETMFCSAMLNERGWENHICLDLAPELDLATIERSCRLLLNAHPIMRTIFVPFKGAVVQTVIANGTIELDKEDCSDVEANTSRWIARDRQLSPSLVTPVVRGAIISQGLHMHRLILSLSHAKYDGISLSEICKDLDRALSGKRIDPPQMTLIKYVSLADASFTDSAKAHWRSYLEGSSMTELVQHDIPYFGLRIDSTHTQEVALPASTSRRFTLATITKAAWAHVLSQWAHTSDVVFGSLTSGRNFTDQDVSRVVGPCLNITPIRLRMDSMTPFELLRETSSQYLDMLPYEAIGYRRLISSCTTWRPWTRLSTIVHHQHIDEADSRLHVIAAENDSADMWILTEPHGSTLTVKLSFSSDAF